MVLCLLIDFEEVFGPGRALDPDAVVMLGELRRLRRDLNETGGDQGLAIVLVDFGLPSAMELFDDLAAATGDDWVLTQVTGGGTAAGLCEGTPGSTILLARSAEPKLAGTMNWRVGDSDAGLVGPADVERRVREIMHVPIPRTIDPARRTGSLTAVPAASSAKRLLAAAYRDPTVDWLTLGMFTIAYCEDGDVEDELATSGAAIRVASAIRKHELYVTGEVAGGLFSDGGYSLIRVVEGEKPPPDAQSWSSLRHQSMP
jgi:hypothetical protein